MPFPFLTQESAFVNLNDKGEGIPNPVICNSYLYPQYGGARRNDELKICLAIWYDMHTPAMGQIKDANNDWYDVLPWNDDFFGWCIAAADAATAAFDDKLMLIPPYRYNGLDRKEPDGTIWRPNIRCRFLCQVGSPSYFHARIKVANTKPKADGRTFRAHSRGWAKFNVGTVTYGSAVGSITQNTAAHETGHLLGLHHIGGVAEVKDCIMLTESPLGGATGNVNYGSNDPDPSFPNNIMGLGMQVSQFNALPWQQEFCKHANQGLTGHVDPLKPHELIGTAEKHYPTQVE